jgi:hypothetical protein
VDRFKPIVDEDEDDEGDSGADEEPDWLELKRDIIS